MASKLSEIVYSGVSWAVNSGTKKIRVIRTWPDPSGKTSSPPKVPSTISYEDGCPKDWGYEVKAKDATACFRWIKLLLQPEYDHAAEIEQVKKSNKLLEELGLSAEDVVTDYLRLLWAFVMQDIRDFRHDYSPDIFDIRVVLTIPAIWKPIAQERTKKAALAAGLPEDISMISEPEAAALVTLKEKADEGTLQVGDAFVVCDAGGGTVDLISYKILGLNPFSIEECAIGDGGLCGSIYLDLAFRQYINVLVGERQWKKLKDKAKLAMMDDFETSVKRTFAADSDREYTVELRGIEDDPNNGIEDETISMTTSSLRSIFEIIAAKIDFLISKQIKSIQEKQLRAKAVLLVGGFGASKYLLRHLRNCHEHENIGVYQVDDAWSSICRGATHWGLENSSHTKLMDNIQELNAQNDTESLRQKLQLLDISRSSTVVSRLARYSYGIRSHSPFDPAIHKESEKYWDSINQEWRAQRQMTWLLKRGEKIDTGRIIPYQVWFSIVDIDSDSTGTRTCEISLYTCSHDKAPTREDTSVSKLCTLSCELNVADVYTHEKKRKNKALKKKFYRAFIDLFMHLNSASLDFGATYHGKDLGKVQVQYREQF